MHVYGSKGSSVVEETNTELAVTPEIEPRRTFDAAPSGIRIGCRYQGDLLQVGQEIDRKFGTNIPFVGG